MDRCSRIDDRCHGRRVLCIFRTSPHGPLQQGNPRDAGPVSLLSYKEDQVASVAVIKNDRGRTLNIDGFNAAGTFRYEYMHLLAHLPIVLSPQPDTVLVICFGTGTTCGTAAIHPTVKRVDCAEISPAVVASARYFSDVIIAPRGIRRFA